MMKNLLTLIMIAAFAFHSRVAEAQSFNSLWKQFEQKEQKDHPRDAMSVLDQIVAKAVQENAYGHLLKAESKRLGIAGALSQDSLAVCLDKLTQRFRSVDDDAEPLRASYAALIATAWQARTDVRTDVANDSAQYYYTEALRRPAALAAAKASTYEPGVEDGSDSRSYQDDMLHVVGRYISEQDTKLDPYTLMHDYYDKAGVRSAACYTALVIAQRKRDAEKQHLLKKSSYITSLDSIGNLYKDLPECAEMLIARYDYMRTADDVTDKERIDFINYAVTHFGSWPRMNYLRNEKSRITMPSYQVRLEQRSILPDRKAEVEVVSLTNLTELTMKIYATSLKGNHGLSLDDAAELKKIREACVGTALQTTTRHYLGLPEYQQVADTIEIEPLKAGVYLLEFTTSNESVPTEYLLLNVSNVTVLSQRMPTGQIRIAVLNATTGQPIRKATVSVLKRSKNSSPIATLKTDERGEVMYTTRDWVNLYATTENDEAMTPTAASSSYYYTSNTADRRYIKLITDRAIYRPGQAVRCAVVAYTTYRNDTPLSDEGREIKLTLRDANHKTVAEKTVTTDAFGKAAADFTLPQNLLTGRFQIIAESPLSSCTFRVEEYKRPTFSVKLEMPQTPYQEGDTVRLKGCATTFSGVAVTDADVKADIQCMRPFWYRWNDRSGSTQSTYTTHTDSLGCFEILVPMETPATGYSHYADRHNIYHFTVSTTVTSMAGESRQAEITIPLSDRAEFLQVEAPSMHEKSDSLQICFTLTNAAGKPIDRQIRYTLGERSFVDVTNKTLHIDVSKITSGAYTLQGICDGDTASTKIILFDLDDRHAPIETHNWFYISSHEFSSTAEPIIVQYGSTDEKQHVLYSVFSGNNIVEQGTVELNSQLRTLEYKYKEEYGDGITLTMAWQREGKTYCYSEQISKPLPEKKLNLEWTSFRDKLIPGQKEKWTALLTDASGKPASASVVATMYDASLDAITKHSLSFNPNMRRYLPSAQWRPTDNYSASTFGEVSFTPLQESSLNFSHFCFDDSLIDPYIYGAYSTGGHTMLRAMTMASVESTAEDATDATVMRAVEVSSEAKKASALSTDETDTASNSTTNDNKGSLDEVPVRENLNETAFFYPQLETDKNGNIVISFTLPESLTSWRLLALATDKEMRFAEVDRTIVAQKELMVQPNMPRFVRKGDRLTIATNISNLANRHLNGTVVMELLDASTEKSLLRRQQQFSVDTAKTAVASFNVDPSVLENVDMLICKFTAKAGTHTDGEQHYLPVMPEKERVTNTYAFTQHHAGTINIDLQKLFKVNDNSSKLTIEYTNHPAWLMVQALPTVAEVNSENAIQLSAGLYATALAQNIVNSSPSIKKTLSLWKQSSAQNSDSWRSQLMQNGELKDVVLSETPWVLEAESESEQRQMLQTYLDESVISQRLDKYSSALKGLQRTDGSFAWWKGMEGNRYITTAVAVTLARQNMIEKLSDSETKMLNSAVAFLADKIEDIVIEIKKELKRTQKKPLSTYLSSTTLDYLYLTSIYDCNLSAQHQADAQYLVDIASKASGEYSIFGKSRLAQIYAHYGKQKLANEYIESIRQYTVYNEEKGRYYDTYKAAYSWRDYRIPTQVASIEAIKAVSPTDTTTVEQMQQWLLTEKRTQMWDNALNTVDAVHAFLEGNMQALGSNDDHNATFYLDGEALETVSPSPAIGYTKTSMSGRNAHKLNIKKTSSSTSWGAVYAQFMQKAADIEEHSEGIKVTREIYVNGSTISNGQTVNLKVGDKIQVRITIKADRDYDFVEIIDKRAACMEPVRQLSGYHGGMYVAPHDCYTSYFVDCMHKGTHFIETEYFIDRAGTYSTGTCTAQCAYSPEYSGRTSAIQLSVTNK